MQNFSSRIEFHEVRWLGRAEPTSGYVVVPRSAWSVSVVRVGTWALCVAKEVRPGEPTFGHFAIGKCGVRGERGRLPQAEPQ